MSAVLDHVARERDRQLVRSHRRGDPTAFAELYVMYHPRLLRFLRRRVGQPQIAEDLAHEAFTRALSGIDNFRDGASFYPWLTGIARHLLIRHYRDTGRLAPLAQTDSWSIDAPEIGMLRRVEREFMTTALARVRARHREVLRLREQEELSYEAIAQRLGIPLTAVAPLLHRARLALRREYLAVTAESNLALAPVLAAATAGLRRLRDRVAQATAYLPDVTAMTTPMAVMAVHVAGILGATALPSTVPVPLNEAPVHAAQADHGGWAPSASPSSGESSHHRASSPAATADLPRVLVSEREMRRGREQDRHMPYYFEYGEHSIGIDPDDMRNDLESSLAGNYDWMEDQ